MATLKTQYENYLKENPNVSYDEWLDILKNKLSSIGEPYVSDDFQIGPDGAFEHTDEDLSDWDNTLMDGLEDE